MRARVYHAGLDGGVREKAQDVFMAGKLDVIVATNAFGMGVDKSDIRLVVHADIPRSPEAYYQEAGRGGRDGKPTRCVLLFNHGDIRLQEFLIDASYPSAELLRGLWKLLRDQPELGRLTPVRRRARGALRVKPRCPRGPRQHRRPAGDLGRGDPRSSSGTACCARDDERLAATRPAARRVRAARRRVAAAARRGRAQQAAHDDRVRVLPAVPPPVRARVLRRRGLGEPRRAPAARCDNCEALAHGRATGLSEAEQQAIRGLLLLVGALNGRFGRTRVAGLAIGTEDDPKFDELPERGCLRGWPRAARSWTCSARSRAPA